MKRIIYITAVVLAGLLIATGCTKKLNEEIDSLKEEVDALEDYVSELNSSYSSLSQMVEALEDNDHITGVEDLGDGTYRITFRSGTSIKLRSGNDGDKPIIGIKYDESAGAYYWTIQQGEKGSVQWLYDSMGRRLRASAIIPKFRVDGGHWEYSYDEINWTDMGVSYGEDGTAVFKSIDASSSEYFVTIKLADGTVFTLPTQYGFEQLQARCDTINKNILAYKEILESQDSNIFIKSVTEIVEGGETVGYDIVLESGKKLTLRSGKDSSEEVIVGFQFDIEKWAVCWAYKNSEEEAYKFIYYNGQKIKAEAEDSTPIIGIQDSAGVYYFTVKVSGADAEFMRDSLGNKVCASPVRFFDEVTAVGDVIKVKMSAYTGFTNTISFYRAQDWTPALCLKDTSSMADLNFRLLTGHERAFLAVIDSIPSSEIANFKYEITAVALDSAYVEGVKHSTDTLKRTSGKWAIADTISFSPSAGAKAGQKTRVAVFLNWDSHTTMKVAEFLNYSN